MQKVFVQDVEQDFLKVRNTVEIADKKEINKFIMKHNCKNFINNEVSHM